MMPN